MKRSSTVTIFPFERIRSAEMAPCAKAGSFEIAGTPNSTPITTTVIIRRVIDPSGESTR